jgi:hypothetical protein
LNIGDKSIDLKQLIKITKTDTDKKPEYVLDEKFYKDLPLKIEQA